MPLLGGTAWTSPGGRWPGLALASPVAAAGRSAGASAPSTALLAPSLTTCVASSATCRISVSCAPTASACALTAHMSSMDRRDSNSLFAAKASSLSTVQPRSQTAACAALPSVQSKPLRRVFSTLSRSTSFILQRSSRALMVAKSSLPVACRPLRQSSTWLACMRVGASGASLMRTCCRTPRRMTRCPTQEGLRKPFSIHSTSRCARAHCRLLTRHLSESNATTSRDTSTTPSTGTSVSNGCIRLTALSSTASLASTPGS
mmetsp:Transcript_82316/g.266801  ORF Transcript_82316/g.266801 Transcript_82316/m.266801 type:complete len:260 (+) Transcript_82316:189-968(+)